MMPLNDFVTSIDVTPTRLPFEATGGRQQKLLGDSSEYESALKRSLNGDSQRSRSLDSDQRLPARSEQPSSAETVKNRIARAPKSEGTPPSRPSVVTADAGTSKTDRSRSREEDTRTKMDANTPADSAAGTVEIAPEITPEPDPNVAVDERVAEPDNVGGVNILVQMTLDENQPIRPPVNLQFPGEDKPIPANRETNQEPPLITDGSPNPPAGIFASLVTNFDEGPKTDDGLTVGGEKTNENIAPVSADSTLISTVQVSADAASVTQDVASPATDVSSAGDLTTAVSATIAKEVSDSPKPDAAQNDGEIKPSGNSRPVALPTVPNSQVRGNQQSTSSGLNGDQSESAGTIPDNALPTVGPLFAQNEKTAGRAASTTAATQPAAEKTTNDKTPVKTALPGVEPPVEKTRTVVTADPFQNSKKGDSIEAVTNKGSGDSAAVVVTNRADTGPLSRSNAGRMSAETSSPISLNTDAAADRLAQLMQSALHQDRTLRVRLSPPELGTLQIEVSNRGGDITARIEVQSSSARQAVLDNLSSLQKSLAQHGTTIDRIEVTLHDFTREEGAADFSNPYDDRPQSENQENQQNQKGETGREETEQKQPSNARSQSGVDLLDLQI